MGKGEEEWGGEDVHLAVREGEEEMSFSVFCMQLKRRGETDG